jgi:hypothetical protein
LYREIEGNITRISKIWVEVKRLNAVTCHAKIPF